MAVYLLHFERRYKHAGHYLGWSPDPHLRLAEHLAGRGARLVAVVCEAGITVTIARLWEGGRDLEKKLKRRKSGVRLCPLCGRRPRKS